MTCKVASVPASPWTKTVVPNTDNITLEPCKDNNHKKPHVQ